MTGQANRISNGELWIRCPFCGDSDHDKTKAHFSINLKTAKYYCFRCGAAGKLTTAQYLRLSESQSLSGIDEGMLTPQDPLTRPILESGPGCQRLSFLPRYHFVDEEFRVWDAFETKRYESGALEPCGVYLRDPLTRTSKIIGESGYGVPHRMEGSFHTPLRIVEGPYDVLTSHDICCFGMITPGKLRPLRGLPVILCPDGDVWVKPGLIQSWIRVLEFMFHSNGTNGPLFRGVEYLPDGKDPDEVPIHQRTLLTPHRCAEYLAKVRGGGMHHAFDSTFHLV